MRNLKLLLASMLMTFSLLISVNVLAQEGKTEGKVQSGNVISKYGNDSTKCVTNLSLYSDYYKQWRASKYKNNELAETSLKYWRYCFLECPRSSQNLYSRGVRLMVNKIKHEKDTLVRDKYVDTLMMVYNQRIEYFPNNPKYPVGYIKGRQAVDLYKYRGDSVVQFHKIFKESFDLMQEKSEPTVLYGYFVATVKLWKSKACELDVVYNTYMDIYDVLQKNINSTNEKKAKKYKTVSDNVEKIMVQIAKCDQLVRVFEPKFDANPTDTILARNLVRIFELRNCTDSMLYYKALAQVHSIAPNAASAYSMGKMSLQKGFTEKAKDYLIQSTQLYTDSFPDKKADAYLLLAETYRKLSQYSNSRKAALKVLEYDPNEAYAYIIIGGLYVESASSCKYKDLPVAYWAAADKFAKAASIATDEKIKKAALAQLANIKKNFPLQQDVFMRNLKVGDAFKVECWINENTTVRVRKQ